MNFTCGKVIFKKLKIDSLKDQVDTSNFDLLKQEAFCLQQFLNISHGKRAYLRKDEYLERKICRFLPFGKHHLKKYLSTNKKVRTFKSCSPKQKLTKQKTFVGKYYEKELRTRRKKNKEVNSVKHFLNFAISLGLTDCKRNCDFNGILFFVQEFNVCALDELVFFFFFSPNGFSSTTCAQLSTVFMRVRTCAEFFFKGRGKLMPIIIILRATLGALWKKYKGMSSFINLLNVKKFSSWQKRFLTNKIRGDP